MKTIRLKPDSMARHISQEYGIPRAQAGRVVAIAQKYGAKAEPVAHGMILLKPSRRGPHLLVLEDRERDSSHDRPAQLPSSVMISKRKGQRVPVNAPAGYDRDLPARRSSRQQQRKETHVMPRRAQVAEPEPEEDLEEKDYTVYADKEITATMVDFHEWLEEVTGAKLDLRSVALGGTLRMEFQKSDFNRERRAERQAERAEGNGAAEEPAEKPAARAGKGRTASARPAAPAATPARGRPAKAATTKPATKTRRGAAAPY